MSNIKINEFKRMLLSVGVDYNSDFTLYLVENDVYRSTYSSTETYVTPDGKTVNVDFDENGSVLGFEFLTFSEQV